jgi:predicted aspartyl protease
MSGVVYPLLLLALPINPPGGAPVIAAQDPELITAESVMEATLLTLGETDKRLTVPVAVNAKGPYNFIIDTGAERTVVSRELANTLKLIAGNPVTLLSMTGRSQVDTVLVPDLMIKSIGVQHSVVAPKLRASDLGAIGLLGIDTLRDHQVSINFERGTMEVRPSQKRNRNARRSSDEIVVTAKSLYGQLIVTDAYYGNTRIQVVLDTGSAVSMGNSALRRRVARHHKTQPIELTDVTGQKTMADYTTVPDIKVGDVMFGSMPIAFADVAPFERFGLTRRPALLLGMDALRSFRSVDIDFPNRQVRFLMPEGSGSRSRMRTGSRLPGGAAGTPVQSY